MGEVSAVGSSEALLDLFLDASDDVYRYISRLTGGDERLTEDIVQDTYVALMRRQRMGGLPAITTGWLIVAARHRLIDHVRSRQRDQRRIERHTRGEPLEVAPVDVGSVSADRARWMLAQLPLDERIALALHTLDGMSVAEVSIEIDRSVDATTSLLARARRRLRNLLAECADEP